jgi:hypothetical protein
LLIARNDWQSGPSTPVAIHNKVSAVVPLLVWVLLLEEFCRRLKAPKTRPREVTPPPAQVRHQREVPFLSGNFPTTRRNTLRNLRVTCTHMN